jgi:hypothetical protein
MKSAEMYRREKRKAISLSCERYVIKVELRNWNKTKFKIQFFCDEDRTKNTNNTLPNLFSYHLCWSTFVQRRNEKEFQQRIETLFLIRTGTNCTSHILYLFSMYCSCSCVPIKSSKCHTFAAENISASDYFKFLVKYKSFEQ